MNLENEQQQQQHDWITEVPKVKNAYLQKFRLYETRSNFYMIGCSKNRSAWRVLKIDRSEPTELNITEDPTTYTEIECSELLKRVHEGNKSTGGLRFVCVCYGIVGFIKFLGPYYMLLITKRRKIGVICGHAIYAITKSEILPIPSSTVQPSDTYSKNENRSFVNSACKCKNVVEVRTTFHPYVLEGINLDLDCFSLFSDLLILNVSFSKRSWSIIMLFLTFNVEYQLGKV